MFPLNCLPPAEGLKFKKKLRNNQLQITKFLPEIIKQTTIKWIEGSMRVNPFLLKNVIVKCFPSLVWELPRAMSNTVMSHKVLRD